MAIVNGDVRVAQSNFFAIRNKFESKSFDREERRTTITGAHFPYETSTLGRRPNRTGSFNFVSKENCSSIKPAGFPFLLRDQQGRSSNRSLPDSGYDSYTIPTPPRSHKRKPQTGSTPTSSPRSHRTEYKKPKEKMGFEKRKLSTVGLLLSPAQSMTNLALSYPPRSPTHAPLRGCVSASVFNLAIAPSTHNVSICKLII